MLYSRGRQPGALQLISLSAHLCLSSQTPSSPATQGRGRGHSSKSDCSGLASASMVCQHGTDGGRHFLAATGAGGPPVPGSHIPPCFTNSGFNGLAIESQVLKDRGLSASVIPTVLRARKSTSRKIYHRTWKAYISLREAVGWHPPSYLVSRILVFLQRGVDQKLALSTIKGQISALAIFFQRSLAAHSLVLIYICNQLLGWVTGWII